MINGPTLNNSLTRANSAEIAGFALPSTENEELAATNGAVYEAPANGFYSLSAKGTSAQDSALGLFNKTSLTGSVIIRNGNGQTRRATIQARKGDMVEVLNNGSSSESKLLFCYAQGEL